MVAHSSDGIRYNFVVPVFNEEYVGRIHAEVKRRPLYVVATKVGFDRRLAVNAVSDDRNSERLAAG